jgi:hypothetical protein
MEEEKAMQELHELRVRNFETTKRLQPAELAEYINKEAEKVAEEIAFVRETQKRYGDRQ